jgi:hypothetical protein
MSGKIQVPGINRLVLLSEPICDESPHFTWAEATKNGARIPVSESVTGNIIKLAKRLELVRARFDGRSIKVTSWYRDPVSNRRIGGSRDSRHLYGDAADIQIAGLTPDRVQTALDPNWDGGLGYGKSFTHLDLRGWGARWDY